MVTCHGTGGTNFLWLIKWQGACLRYGFFLVVRRSSYCLEQLHFLFLFAWLTVNHSTTQPLREIYGKGEMLWIAGRSLLFDESDFCIGKQEMRKRTTIWKAEFRWRMVSQRVINPKTKECMGIMAEEERCSEKTDEFCSLSWLCLRCFVFLCPCVFVTVHLLE